MLFYINNNEQADKPSSVLNDHLSSPIVTNRLQRPTRKHGGQPYSLLYGLAPDGVYMCPFCYQKGGELLPRLSTLTKYNLAVYFCCTFLKVTFTRRYLASCPTELGLSSPVAFQHLQVRPFSLLIAVH